MDPYANVDSRNNKRKREMESSSSSSSSVVEEYRRRPVPVEISLMGGLQDDFLRNNKRPVDALNSSEREAMAEQYRQSILKVLKLAGNKRFY